MRALKNFILFENINMVTISLMCLIKLFYLPIGAFKTIRYDYECTFDIT